MRQPAVNVGLFLAATLGIILLCAVPIFAEQSADSSKGPGKQLGSVLVVERDVPQTRVGFDPVVNHEALVANLSDETIKVDIESPVPSGLYVVKKFFPAFGQKSLLAIPMEFPEKVEVSNYKVLERPLIDTKKGKTVFRWKDVFIAPREGVIAQYDNYSGPLSQFYTDAGIRVLGLDVRSTYKASAIDGGGGVVFDLYYELENRGKEEMKGIMMDLILPDTVYNDETGPPVQLFEMADAVASPEIKIMRGLLGDGFGKAAEGVIFTIAIDSLKPGSSRSLWMKVIGKKPAKQGKSYPLISFQGQTKGSPLWPSTNVKTQKKLRVSRYSYQYANLILPDKRLFSFEPTGVRVVEKLGGKHDKGE
jgi:hypothetical protein